MGVSDAGRGSRRSRALRPGGTAATSTSRTGGREGAGREGGGQAPGSDPASAPRITYGLPSATEFEFCGFLPLNLPADFFVPQVQDTPVKDFMPTYHKPSVAGSASRGSIKAAVVSPPLLANPDDRPWDWVKWSQDVMGASAQAEVGMQPEEGLLPSPLPSSANAFLGSTNLARNWQNLIMAPRPAVISAGADRYVGMVTKNFFGDLVTKFLVARNRPDPKLFIVEYYRSASFLSDFGLTNVVSTVTLLPGEKTTVNVSQTIKEDSTRSVTTNVLDSYNSQSANELESRFSDQQTLVISAGDQSSDGKVTSSGTQESASIRVHGGISLSGSNSASGSIGHQSAETDTTNHNQSRQQTMNTASNAMDHHVNQTSSTRSMSVSTGTQQNSLSVGQQNVTVRNLENINKSRVLHFVIRQLSQRYWTVTYLHDVGFVFQNGTPDDAIVAKLDSVNELLSTVVVENKRRDVLARIVQALSNVLDSDGVNRRLIKALKCPEDNGLLTETNLPVPVPKVDASLPRFVRCGHRTLDAYRRGKDENGVEQQPNQEVLRMGSLANEISIDEIVLDVKRRMLPAARHCPGDERRPRKPRRLRERTRPEPDPRCMNVRKHRSRIPPPLPARPRRSRGP